MCALFLVLGLCNTQAQTSLPTVSEPCRAVNTSQPELERRLQKLQEERSTLIARQTQLRSGIFERQELDANLRLNQERTLETVYALECFRTNLFVDPALTRGPTDVQQWIELTVYYGTNRKQTGNATPEGRYSVEPGPLELGRAVISIPTVRKPGAVPLPSLWRFELRPDPNKHFILKSVTPLSFADARQELTSRVGETKSALVFVHGYNVTFADAAIRTAQLAHDLSFIGVPIFFSWPSAGKTLSYWHDEETVLISEPAFDSLLDEVSALGFDDVYLVAHSMGNRLAANVLRRRAENNHNVANLREILLAAPDINEQVFRDQIAPRIAAIQGVRRTIYASSGDLALRASKIVHEYRRVGETTDGVRIFAGFETIDASAVAPTWRAFGHSYVVDSAKVLGDIQDLIYLRFGADRRRLPRQGEVPDVYWVLR